MLWVEKTNWPKERNGRKTISRTRKIYRFHKEDENESLNKQEDYLKTLKNKKHNKSNLIHNRDDSFNKYHDIKKYTISNDLEIINWLKPKKSTKERKNCIPYSFQIIWWVTGKIFR